ncbi:MAG: alkaline phosphatase family protein, partial [Aestuariibacter sp.]|nr:alkaline phosphatase family protein [Aestuariibacter sp.]
MQRLVVFVIACFSIMTSSVYATSDQHVVLISIDGFRHDYIEKHKADDIGDIARQRTSEVGVELVYPANSLHNPSSLFSGLLPV